MVLSFSLLMRKEFALGLSSLEIHLVKSSVYFSTELFGLPVVNLKVFIINRSYQGWGFSSAA